MRFPLRVQLSLLLLLGITTAGAAEPVYQRLVLQDGRTLIGIYDAASGRFDLVNEKTLKVMAQMQIDAAQIRTREEIQLAAPPSAGAAGAEAGAEQDGAKLEAKAPEGKRGANGKWLTNYAAVVKLATEVRRPILVVFTGSDWCPWCVKLEREMLSNQQFKDWAAKNVVLLYLDFPRNSKQTKELEAQNAELAKKYGVTGFPTILLLNERGEKYEWKFGYSDAGFDAWLRHIDTSKVRLTK